MEGKNLVVIELGGTKLYETRFDSYAQAITYVESVETLCYIVASHTSLFTEPHT